MKNKYKFLFILTFVVVFLCYRVNFVVAMASEEPEQNVESAAGTEVEQATEPEPDSVSTGTALVEWLELHKNTGGTVKLADHVIMDGTYNYCPDGANKPSVLVDTGQYTITVTGEIDFLSDNQLTFSGQPDDKALFCVAEKGMLSMQGVAVESGQYALWQEEGAGLVVGGCRILGNIHYADTPFVVYQDAVCVVVEKEQTLHDVLPEQIICTVNRQGKLSYNEQVPISWELAESGKQQEQRRRFRLQGSFVQAASVEPALCTVAYNDYPLTFTEVRAAVSGSWYTFKGWYTKPEKSLPITVISEYSFDGENWIVNDEEYVTDPKASFVIAFKCDPCDLAAHPNIYIRLQWNDNGTPYFSNVLCYAAGNLECVEDIGGSRGGGTSITNPPDEPQISAGTAASEKEEPSDHANRDNDSGNTGLETPADTNPTESGGGARNTYEEQPLHAETQNAGQSSFSEDKIDNNVIDSNKPGNKENISHSDSGNSEKVVEAVAAISVKRENHAGNTIVMSAGFVLLAVIAGIAGFCVHSRSGTKR